MATNVIINPPGPAPLTYCAIGDSYGFCFEMAPGQFVRANNDLKYHPSRNWATKPGVYSDDTQMQTALAEVIASEREWTPRNIADAFVSVYKRDPRPGYSNRTRRLLESVANGEELLARIVPLSEKNGACMRGPIVGLFPSIEEVIGRSEVQARITHDTKVGVDSAVAAALMAHYFAYDLGAKSELPDFLDKYVPGYKWGTPWSGLVEVHGTQTIRAALTAILQHDSLSALLRRCVAFTGDVDSVAAVALASASSHARFVKDIPENLWRECEPGQYGLEYLYDLDRRVRAVTIECRGR